MHDPERKTPNDGAPTGGDDGRVVSDSGQPPDAAEAQQAPAGEEVQSDVMGGEGLPAAPDDGPAPATLPPPPAEVKQTPAESAPAVVETPPSATATSIRSVVERDKERSSRRWKDLSPIARAALAIAGGAALIGAALAPLLSRGGSTAPLPQASAAPLAAALAGSGAVLDGGSNDGGSEAASDAALPREPVWRVAQLSEDPDITLTQSVIGHRSLLGALASARLSHTEAQRLTKSLGAVRSVDHIGPKDALTIALDKATGRVVAYELASSPADVWQGREQPEVDGTTKLETRKLELVPERVRVGKAVVVGADLRASLAEAGLAPVDDVLAMLDDALEGHAELSDIRPGARLRVVATQEQVDGSFVRWVSVEAVEYFPASANAPSVRVYSFGDADEGGEAKKHRGWYDAKGRQPFHGGFRTPVPLARIASRFNPHRMHPVLHVVMPHNGVDFAAPIGAPVYATAAGVVTSVGYEGPCGNKVEIAHAGGITSIYCHLSRFAPGLRVGTHVEQRQLIAYVGQTGRVTGPHLHFGIRRGGVFVDPMTLRLDGVRVVPRTLRDEFDHRRSELDAELDDIPLPALGFVPPETTEPETFYEEP